MESRPSITLKTKPDDNECTLDTLLIDDDDDEKRSENDTKLSSDNIIDKKLPTQNNQSEKPVESENVVEELQQLGAEMEKNKKCLCIWCRKTLCCQSMNKKRKDRYKKRISKWLIAFSAFSVRYFSIVDMFTDIFLLSKSVENDDFLPISIVLFLSIISPYILSYSSGVRLFLFRRSYGDNRLKNKNNTNSNNNNNNNTNNMNGVTILLYLLPTGIIYFLLLDVVDIILTLLRLFFLFKFKEMSEIRQIEYTVAKKIGKMDRMNWHGFKRQKSIGMLSFETIPQLVIQLLLYFNIIFSNKDFATDNSTSILISVISAFINGFVQIIKNWKEAETVTETPLQYALTCAMGRVGWLPHKGKIRKLLSSGEYATNSNSNNNNNINNDDKK